MGLRLGPDEAAIIWNIADCPVRGKESSGGLTLHYQLNLISACDTRHFSDIPWVRLDQAPVEARKYYPNMYSEGEKLEIFSHTIT